jgi:GMP synthase (glutamine-hydrolysing)
VRSLGVRSKVFPLSIDADAILRCEARAIIISGGPASANDADLEYDRRIFSLGLPILGICLGMQILAVQDRGKVAWMGMGERKVGQYCIDIDNTAPLFRGLRAKEPVCLTHDETCVLPVRVLFSLV